MAGTDIADNLLTAGTNQGVERSVLPMPQLNIASNVRMRKGARWGKRYGHAALSSTNLGSGTGLNRCMGVGFAVVDDRCSKFDRAAGAFIAPRALVSGNTLPRVPGVVSGWVPDTSFFPVPRAVAQGQNTTPCSSCYALGYLWTAVSYTDPAHTTDKIVRVVATNPTDQTLVFMQDVPATTAGFGGVTYPKLVACGSTVILTCLNAPSVGNLSVVGSKLTSLAGGFGTVSTIAAVNLVAYDAAPYSSTQFLVVTARSTGAANPLLVNASTLSAAASQLLTDGAGNITEVTIVGVATDAIYVGYGIDAANTAKVAVYPSGLGAITATATVSTFTGGRPLLCLLPGGGVRVVYDVVIALSILQFAFRDVTSAGAVATAYAAHQLNLTPMSLPFAVGANVYMWAFKVVGTASFGAAMLIRLPAPAEFVTVAPGSGSITVCCPLEMSVQDYLVSPGSFSPPAIDQAGIPTVAQIGTSVSYAVPVPTVYTTQDITKAKFSHDFRILQTKHFSDTAAARGFGSVSADLSSFLPIGTLTRVANAGAIEEGFAYAPTVTGSGASGGALTASSDYYYSAVFKSRNDLGRFEASAPSIPVKVTLTAGQGTVNLKVSTMDLTARPTVQIEIYRTLANAQTFYLVETIDGSATSTSTGSVAYTDTTADSVIAIAQALYVQVGQTLANAFPPASRFGCVGGQRLFLGGLIRPDVVQASKLIFGDQSPTFADNDAFRIVLPSPCTGLAWMDSLVLFTGEGIYIVSGDGPDDSGYGDFGNLTRMPYELGCIEPRSVKVVDDGCFFQTSRGLYLLPRGFGAPTPAGDSVMDTLASYPVITGVATVTKAQEQSVVWTCSNAGGTQGVRIVYDLAHNVWSIDNFADITGSSASPCGIGQWLGGEIAQFGSTLTQGLQASNSTYADANNTAIQMTLRTGDIRPFGVVSQGVITKADLLAEVRSACTLSVTKTTEYGTNVASRVFALAAGDAQIGDLAVTETSLGNAELRDAMSLRLQYDETSTSEGLAFIALSLEHEQGEGLKRVNDLSRNT